MSHKYKNKHKLLLTDYSWKQCLDRGLNGLKKGTDRLKYGLIAAHLAEQGEIKQKESKFDLDSKGDQNSRYYISLWEYITIPISVKLGSHSATNENNSGKHI